MVAVRFLALAAVAALLAGCSGGDDADAEAQRPASAVARSAIPLGPAPRAIGQVCGITALRVKQTLCPLRVPAKRGSQADAGQVLAGDDYDGYLLEWHMTKFRGEDGGHFVVGSQPREFDLSRGARVRADAEMRLPGRKKLLRRAKVGTAPALVLQSPPYPRGGVNGGHVSVLWNSEGRGYLVSLHFEGYPLRDRIAAAISTARSMSPVPPGGNCDPGGPSDCG